MHVLVHGQYGLVRGQAGQLLHERVKGALLLLLRTQLERRIAVAGGDRQQRGEERGSPGDILSCVCDEGLELVELLRRAIIPGKARGSFKQVDHGIERTGLVERRTEVTEMRVGLTT